MRYLMMMMSDESAESGEMPDEEVFTAMGKYNDELLKAGVLLAAEGLHPSSKGFQVRFTGDGSAVTDGPFAEAKELVAGYWVLQVSSRDEAVEWAQRCPAGPDGVLHVRQIGELEDFGDEVTPETREAEARMREQLGQR